MKKMEGKELVGDRPMLEDKLESSGGQPSLEMAPSAYGSRIRLGLLTSVLLIEVAAFMYLLSQNPWAMATVVRWMHPEYFQPPKINYVHQLRRDPPLGLQLPDYGSAAEIQKIVPSSSHGYLIVWIGDCTSCLQYDLKSWQLEARHRGISLALLTTASRTQAEAFRQERGLSAPAVVDSKRRLSTILNALWPGRTYLFSTGWRLLWYQKVQSSSYNPFQDPGFQAAYKEMNK